jgi:hypothetical protein
VKDKIKELNSQDDLSFTDQEELDSLSKQNNELQRKIDLLKLEQEIKQAQINSEFVTVMESSLDPVIDDSGLSTGGDMLDLTLTRYESLNKQLVELESQYQKDLQNAIDAGDTDSAAKIEAQYNKKKKHLESQIKSTYEYLDKKNKEFQTDSEGISYISDPDTDVEQKTNKWLDYINDFQDRLLIASGIDGAKSGAFTRLIDGPFDKATKKLRTLGQQGKVTANDLNDPQYAEFINKLYSFGFTTDEIVLAFNSLKDSATSTATETARAYETALSNSQSLLSEIETITTAINEQNSGNSISLETYNALIASSSKYADCLEYQNGVIQINSEKLSELTNARANEQIAINDTNKALAQAKYIKNAAEIERLRDLLKGDSAYRYANAEAIQLNISALLSANEELKIECDRYALLTAAISEATSAYQHWINSQNASQTGDIFDGALNAINEIDETLNNPESDLFMRIGRGDYKAAIDFIVPDTVDKEDEQKVNEYLESIHDMFTYDEGGNRSGLNIGEFCKRAVDEGLMVLNEAGTDYEIAGGKTMQDFADGLKFSLPFVQAMFGEMQEFGVNFDWVDESSKSVGDLAVSAYEAAEALREIDGNEDLSINLDVSGLNDTDAKVVALSNTIEEMQDFKISANTEDIEQANRIIEYCVAQKQILTAPDVMKVDTSMVSGEVSHAISLLQDFVAAQNQIESLGARGLSTESAEKTLSSITEQIKSLDANVLAELRIDPASIDSISQSINKLTADTLIEIGINDEAILNFQASTFETGGTVTWTNDDEEVTTFIATVKYANGIVRWRNDYSGRSGLNSLNGTAHASGTANANGNWGTATGGKTLVGELGREIIVDPYTGRWYTVGEYGAEFVNIPRNAIVFNHVQSESLLNNGYVFGRGKSNSTGPAYVTGSIPIDLLNKFTSFFSSSGATSSSTGGSASSGQGSSTPSESFEDAYKRHKHLLTMEQETFYAYLEWLKNAFEEAYSRGEIELNDYRKYAEEVFEGQKELFEDGLNDIEHKISILARDDANGRQIINMYNQLIMSVDKQIEAARARGLDDDSDYIQELLDKRYEYQDEIKDIQDEATDGAKDAVKDLVDYRIDMIKQGIEDEKDALDKKLDDLKDFYDKQKEMLQDAYDEEKYLDEQSEKRKAKSDIEAELARLERDDSAWAEKRKLELQEELADAEKELVDFEKDHALESAQDMLDKLYERQEEQIQSEIDLLDEKLNDPKALYNQALADIQSNTLALYEEMVAYNDKHGSGNAEDTKEMWDEAKESLDKYLSTYGEVYKGIILVPSPGGYSSGTASAAAGVREVDELGSEYLFTSKDGHRYRVFSGGEKVLNAKATNFLYNFATSGGSILSKICDSISKTVGDIGNIGSRRPIAITTGDIIVQGNADQNTVSELRRLKRDEMQWILKEFNKMNKRT